MANHKSSLKRIRSDKAKRELNRYQKKSTRTQIKKLEAMSDKSEAQEQLKKVEKMVDKLSKKNIVHHRNAANTKSRLAKLVSSL